MIARPIEERKYFETEFNDDCVYFHYYYEDNPDVSYREIYKLEYLGTTEEED